MTHVTGSSPTGGLPVAPSLATTLDIVAPATRDMQQRGRMLPMCALCIGIAILAAMVAQILSSLIGLITNIAFYGRIDTEFVSPFEHHLGAFVIVVPVIGGLIVGVMARFGSAAIRGHGIPEAMEQVLLNESRISPRVMFFKPISSAIAIGTGGPFGAEGPIIATGGALGSVIGQHIRISADERKTLLAAGAAAGMAATFGSPVSALLLAVELLLFEYRPRSLVPIALATATATGIRIAFEGNAPAFAMSAITQPSGLALAGYIMLGVIVGAFSVLITRAVYAVEDAFDHLPVHWMWWPAIGGVAVGVIGYFAPRTLGVGYVNIQQIISGQILGEALIVLVVLKFLSWVIALGSGTSGGTLAPLFTVGGGLGVLLGSLCAHFVPELGIDVRIAGLVGMAAVFAGASQALLASVIFAFETTRQPLGLLPLLGGCSGAYLISYLTMRNSIMTEKLARRGTRVQQEYAADYLDQITAAAAATRDVVTLTASQTVESVRAWIAAHGAGSTHQGFPVVDENSRLVGVLTRRDVLDPDADAGAQLGSLIKRPPVVVYEDNSLREAADHMVRAKVGRVIVVDRSEPRVVRGILSRSDLLEAHESRLNAGIR